MAQGDKIIGYGRLNRRRDRRRPVACRLVPGRGRSEVTTKDMSMGGFAVPGVVPGLACGTIIPVVLETPGGGLISVQARVVRNGKVAGRPEADFAVAFQALSPEAFSGLERIMMAPLRAEAALSA